MSKIELRKTSGSKLYITILSLIIVISSDIYLGKDNPKPSHYIIGIISIMLLIYSLHKLLKYTSEYVEFYDNTLSISNQKQTKELTFSDIDEVFYIVQIDETPARTYEKPIAYHFITGNSRTKIDLTNYHNEDIILLNNQLQTKLGTQFRREERFVRKVDESSNNEENKDNSFIELNTVNKQ